uniref:Uncharacterized protein n=1 Tax=Parasteatoda tepidariorum TaxID=114398 RepID=A0A2L2YM18_PARTP
MSYQKMFKYLFFASVWIYSVHAAPIESDEPVILEDSNIESCLKQGLPDKMKETYDICAAQNPDVEMVNDNEVLKCVLKTQEVITGEEEMIDLNKLKVSEETTEEVVSDQEMPEQHLFSIAIQKCEENEEVKAGQASELIQCLLENLIMNCTQDMKAMEMVPMAMEESESKEVNMMAPMTMEENEMANDSM